MNSCSFQVSNSHKYFVTTFTPPSLLQTSGLEHRYTLARLHCIAVESHNSSCLVDPQRQPILQSLRRPHFFFTLLWSVWEENFDLYQKFLFLQRPADSSIVEISWNLILTDFLDHAKASDNVLFEHFKFHIQEIGIIFGPKT